ncbi:V-type proton ATPase subunit A [Wickerhamomyces ciferrii]|uniref:V-type proton ATPase subunit A n=1 Tax=Wickerhamomyces ciferrii (strain ATCC 14091 / BCRC 22168 / CBS 111 / JCM 3599 / NBRC 0793 / NRRL Y-1031 F-60-10) TaxID=1206466 RepID=K0KC60_WICCF|nr:V-type proton ATPase subunit A [Wickerhamomyces ciferrii]CCH40481.1 V-type proton ATPase subunit A [Wickerhamomyces ciferrii]
MIEPRGNTAKIEKLEANLELFSVLLQTKNLLDKQLESKIDKIKEVVKEINDCEEYEKKLKTHQESLEKKINMLVELQDKSIQGDFEAELFIEAVISGCFEPEDYWDIDDFDSEQDDDDQQDHGDDELENEEVISCL